MRHFLIIAFILFIGGFYEARPQHVRSPKPFVIRLSHDIVPTSLWITYYMTGPFGGYGSFVRTDAKIWDYVVPTANEGGKPAKKMRLIINSSKYKTQFFDLQDSNDQDRVIDVALEPRTTLKFTGMILSQNKLSSGSFEVRVGYGEEWLCGYFGLFDCLTGTFPITSVDIDENGRFYIDLPDFASDPVIASFGDNGSFRFFLRDKKSGNILYRLQPENGRKGLDEVRVASSYPVEQVFIAERSN